MSFSIIDYILLFASSFGLVSVITPLMRVVALKYNVIDLPTESHKTHKSPMPYLGGVGIVISVISISLISIITSGFTLSRLLLASSVLIPALALSIVGLIDDIVRLPPLPRFIAQNLIGIVVATILIVTNTVGAPTGSTLFDLILSILWIVGISNSINFFDNIDGGASGAVAISSFFLSMLALQNDQILIAGLSVVVTGSTLGFLLWNRPPARIYMGDSGSLFLGVLLASLTLRLEPNPINRWAGFAIPIFLLAIPILDSAVAITSRLRRRVSPFQGGRDHLSHRLMRKGLSKQQSVVTLWLLSAFFACVSLGISNAAYQFEFLITSVFLIALIIIYFMFLIWTSDQ
jgi:UDP-GlcNAc:undecaprenyl-phosphate GlcNAc-1-phosphate transferase